MNALPLPPGWLTLALDDVVDIHDELREPVNATARATRYGPYPYYGATGQVGWIDDYRQDGEFVLLGEDGAPFLERGKPKAYMVQGRAWVNNHAHVLRGIDGLIANRFLLHSLNGVDYRGHVNGTTRLKLTQAAMRQLPLRVPPLPEQHRIVAKIEELFSDLDAGVLALERVRIALKRYRASVLKAAVEGRLTEKWRDENPNVEPADELLRRILDERRNRWERGQLAQYEAKGKKPPGGWREKYTEPTPPEPVSLRALPDTWTWTALGQLLHRSEYGTSVKCSPEAGVTPVLRIPNIRHGVVDIGDMKYSTEDLKLEADDFLRQSDLLVCRTNGSIGLVGRSALVCQQFGAPTYFASYLLRLRFTMPRIIATWVQRYLSSPEGRSFIESHAASSAGQHNVSLSLLHTMPVPLPPSSELEALVMATEETLSESDHVTAQIETLLPKAGALHQAILKRAFQGRLVPQDPTDEPASILLDRMKAEREQTAPRQKTRRRSAAVTPGET